MRQPITIPVTLNLALAYSLDEIRSLAKTIALRYEVILHPGRSRWLYVPGSMNEDDGVDWLLPSWNTTEKPGRWGRWQLADTGDGGVTLPIAESDVTGLVADLANLQDQIDDAAVLPIAESDVTGLVSDLAAKEAIANKGAASGYASLNSSTKVVEDPANATATPTASKIPIADGSGKLAAGWGGSASTLATLNGSTKVVEDPANATATPAASKIVIADAGGKVDGWVSDADASTKGKVKLAGDLAGSAATPEVAAIHETSGPTKLTIGTIADGQFLKRSGSSLISAAVSAGVSIDQGAVGSRPAAGNAGNLYLSTDHQLMYRDDGSLWQGYIVSKKLKDPNIPTWTWTNQGSASVTTEGGTLLFTSPKAANDNIRLYRTSAPGSTPYTFEIAFSPNYPIRRNFLAFGIAFYKSTATEKFLGFMLGATGNDFAAIHQSGSLTTWSYQTQYTLVNFANFPVIWLRGKDDGTNLIFYVSSDGVHWLQIHSETRASFTGTPDTIGIFGLHNDATYDCSASVLHWETA